ARKGSGATVEYYWNERESTKLKMHKLRHVVEVCAATNRPLDISDFPGDWKYYVLAVADSYGMDVTYMNAKRDDHQGNPDGGQARLNEMRGELAAGTRTNPKESLLDKLARKLGGT